MFDLWPTAFGGRTVGWSFGEASLLLGAGETFTLRGCFSRDTPPNELGG